MEIKQRGNAFGHKILLFIYNIFGYNFVLFILNFVALYYLFFTPSVKKSMRSYYEHQGIKLTNRVYFKHLKMFAISIFDRFVSRINKEDLFFERYNAEVIEDLQNGGVILLSHVGSWAAAAHSLGNKFPLMHIVMRENTQENIHKVEEENRRDNEDIVKIIDLNKGAIAANIQIANALMAKELVALMADRVVDKRQSIDVEFFGSKIQINKNPFDIAKRLHKPLVAIFVMNTSVKKYDLILNLIEEDTIEKMAQNYTNVLEEIIKKHPNQWYNFYDFFKQGI